MAALIALALKELAGIKNAQITSVQRTLRSYDVD